MEELHAIRSHPLCRGLHRPGSTRRGSGLVKMIAIKRCIEHFGLSRAILFSQRKVIRSCAHLMLVIHSGSGNKSYWLDFLRDFLSCPLLEIVWDNTLQTWHPRPSYHSSNAKITSDVLRASLNNSFKDYCSSASSAYKRYYFEKHIYKWHLCIKGNMD
jgi:hypothetical protein